MGWVLERATGQRYADLVGDVFWRRIGAAQGAYITVDRLGAPRCAGGICMTTPDLARVGQMVLEGGQGVIPAAWLEDIARNGDPDAWAKGDFAAYFPETEMHYRAFWYVMRDKGPLLICVGIHGQSLLVDLTSGLVMAKHASHPDPTNAEDKLRTLKLFDAVRTLL